MTPLARSTLLEWRTTTNGISEYVFFNPQRPSVHIRSVKTAWHNALKMAGIRPFAIYQCRHTFATRLAASGVSDTIIDQFARTFPSRRAQVLHCTSAGISPRRDHAARSTANRKGGADQCVKNRGFLKNHRGRALSWSTRGFPLLKNPRNPVLHITISLQSLEIGALRDPANISSPLKTNHKSGGGGRLEPTTYGYETVALTT